MPAPVGPSASPGLAVQTPRARARARGTDLTTDQGQPSGTPSDLHVQAARHAPVTTSRALLALVLGLAGALADLAFIAAPPG